MTNVIKSFALVALMAAGFPALAQDSGTSAPVVEQETAPGGAEGLSLGETVDDSDRIGTTYTRETFGDWELRCVRTSDGKDPCQMYQLLLDQSGNAVAEINLFPLNGGGGAVAGASIITPLETLLTEQITLSVDGAPGKRYPFSWCGPIGCVSRVGITATELETLKSGAIATLSIVPVAAADQPVVLTVSLTGFTAAYKAVSETNQAFAN